MLRLCAASSALVLTLSLAACGTDATERTVVSVGRHSISRAEVAHWMSIIAARASAAPGQPSPQVPQPPDYLACVRYKRRYGPATAQAALSSRRLKLECALEYRKLELKALYLLITYRWVAGEAAELGVSLTKDEVSRALEALERSQSSGAQGFRRYSTATRATVADLALSIKLNLLTTKIQARLESKAAERRLTARERQQALNRFGVAFRARWTARTDCTVGYVVPLCRRYKQRPTPGSLVPPSVPLTNMAAE
jgi:hypothetical protein